MPSKRWRCECHKAFAAAERSSVLVVAPEPGAPRLSVWVVCRVGRWAVPTLSGPRRSPIERVGGGYGPGKERRDARWTRLVGSLYGAGRDWSRPNRGVRWNRARPGRGGWIVSLCGRGEPTGRPVGTGVGVPVDTRAAQRFGWRRFHRPGAGG